jgi:hypothetical protein
MALKRTTYTQPTRVKIKLCGVGGRGVLKKIKKFLFIFLFLFIYLFIYLFIIFFFKNNK